MPFAVAAAIAGSLITMAEPSFGIGISGEQPANKFPALVSGPMHLPIFSSGQLPAVTVAMPGIRP